MMKLIIFTLSDKRAKKLYSFIVFISGLMMGFFLLWSKAEKNNPGYGFQSLSFGNFDIKSLVMLGGGFVLIISFILYSRYENKNIQQILINIEKITKNQGDCDEKDPLA